MPCHELQTLIILFFKTYISIASDKKGDRDNSEIFFLFLNEKIFCVPPLELSWQDRVSMNYPCYPFLSKSVLKYMYI